MNGLWAIFRCACPIQWGWKNVRNVRPVLLVLPEVTYSLETYLEGQTRYLQTEYGPEAIHLLLLAENVRANHKAECLIFVKKILRVCRILLFHEYFHSNVLSGVWVENQWGPGRLVAGGGERREQS